MVLVFVETFPPVYYTISKNQKKNQNRKSEQKNQKKKSEQKKKKSEEEKSEQNRKKFLRKTNFGRPNVPRPFVSRPFVSAPIRPRPFVVYRQITGVLCKLLNFLETILVVRYEVKCQKIIQQFFILLMLFNKNQLKTLCII